MGFAIKQLYTTRLLLYSTLHFFCVIESVCQFNGHLELSFGPGFPIGDFAQTENDGGGFAKNGTNLNLKAGIRIKDSKVSVGLLVRRNTYGFNTSTVKSTLENGFPGTSFDKWDEQTKSWKIVSAMPGISFVNSFDKKFSFGAGIHGGIANASSCEFIMETNGRNSQFIYNIKTELEREDTYAFSFLLQAGSCYQVTKKIGVVLNVDFFSLKPEFKYVKVTESYTVTQTQGGNSSTFPNDRRFTQTVKMHSINTSVGIRYKF